MSDQNDTLSIAACIIISLAVMGIAAALTIGLWL